MTEQGFRPSGLTQESFNNMVTGAGALYFGIDYSAIDAETTMTEFAQMLQTAQSGGKALGATTGGVTVSLKPKIRQIEVDDLPAPIAGSTVQDGWESATMATTIKEITKKNIERVIATAKENAETGAIEFGTKLLPEHFDKSLTWAGATIEGGILSFRLDGAMNTEGFTVTSTSGGEGSVAVTFAGHLKTLEDVQKGLAPLRAYFFTPSGSEEIGGEDDE